MEELLTPKQAAEYCGINKGNFNKNVKKGKINIFLKENGFRRYRKEDLDIFNASRKSKTKSQDGDTTIEPSAAEDSKTASTETEPVTESTIDSELQALIPPLSEAEYAKLTESCQREGIRDPIILWGDIILDGHHRYRIAKEFNLPFKTEQASCHTYEEAIHWMINNQLGRRNMNKFGRCLLVLKLKPLVQEESKLRMLAGKVSVAPMQISSKGSTREILAEMAGVSHDTFTKVERLNKEAPEELKAKLLAGDISINGAINELNKILKPQIEIKDNIATPDISTEIVTEDPTAPVIDSLPADKPDISQNTASVVNNSLHSDISPSFNTAQDLTSPEDIAVVKVEPENVAPAAVLVNDTATEISESKKGTIQPPPNISSSVPPIIYEAMETMRACLSNFRFYSSAEDLKISWRGDVILQPPQELVQPFAEKLNKDKANIEHVIFVISGNNNPNRYILGIPSEDINLFFV